MSDREGFERSLTRAVPHGEMLAQAVSERFLAEVQLQGSASLLSPICFESIWRHGQIAIRYRLRSTTQQVEVLSVAVAESEAK